MNMFFVTLGFKNFSWSFCILLQCLWILHNITRMFTGPHRNTAGHYKPFLTVVIPMYYAKLFKIYNYSQTRLFIGCQLCV